MDTESEPVIPNKRRCTMIANMNELQGFRMYDVCIKTLLSDHEFETWLQQLGLLHSRRTCPSCENDMKLYRNNTIRRVWTCNRRACRKKGNKPKIGFYIGTFFESCKINPKKVFLFSYVYLQQLGTLEQMEYEASIARDTSIQWSQYIRDIFSEYFIDNPRMIGGPDVEVEVDKTCIIRRKYNLGKVAGHQQQWMFGGIERVSGHGFMQLVDEHNAAALLPIIEKHVKPGSIIFSNLGQTKNEEMSVLPQGHHQFSDNHRVQFVDLKSGAHTRKVENQWTRFKKRIKRSNGLNTSTNDRYTDYLQEFMWRQEFGKRSLIFFNFWSQVCANYPCEQ